MVDGLGRQSAVQAYPRMILLSSVLVGATPITSQVHKVTPIVCDDDYAYGRAWAEYWSHDDTIVNVEHDMEYRDDLVDALMSCHRPLCTYAYKVHPVGHGWVYAQSVGGRWIETDQTESDFSGIGFCKIAPGARLKPLKTYPWKFVEQTVNDSCSHRWHIHWPAITHHHDYTEPETPWQLLVKSLA